MFLRRSCQGWPLGVSGVSRFWRLILRKVDGLEGGYEKFLEGEKLDVPIGFELIPLNGSQVEGEAIVGV